MTIRELDAIEKASIREFVDSCADLFTGRVLDYGCGRQPYRDVVEKAGGEYVPWDRKALPGGSVDNYGPRYPLDAGEVDVILCTQVLQYVGTPGRTLAGMTDSLRRGGALVLTGPGCWPEIPGHLHSFTREGIRRLLEGAGFTVERVEARAALPFDGFELSLGWGAVARA